MAKEQLLKSDKTNSELAKIELSIAKKYRVLGKYQKALVHS